MERVAKASLKRRKKEFEWDYVKRLARRVAQDLYALEHYAIGEDYAFFAYLDEDEDIHRLLMALEDAWTYRYYRFPKDQEKDEVALLDMPNYAISDVDRLNDEKQLLADELNVLKKDKVLIQKITVCKDMTQLVEDAIRRHEDAMKEARNDEGSGDYFSDHDLGGLGGICPVDDPDDDDTEQRDE